jgi:MarR family transcriptional regulator, organic hydroperoxide resistance regulator
VVTEYEHDPTPTGRILDGLRTFGANYTEFTRLFAAFLGLHATDAAALAEILYAEDRGTPLSPARLSERVRLSSGATTALINRLEQAGHVVRTREHTDRRIVTLRSSGGIQRPAMEFFRPLDDHLTAMLGEYSPEQIRLVERFLAHLGRTMGELLVLAAARGRSTGA